MYSEGFSLDKSLVQVRQAHCALVEFSRSAYQTAVKQVRGVQQTTANHMRKAQRTVNRTLGRALETDLDASDVIGVTQFPRFIQYDNHSCYARCVQSILWFHRKLTPIMLIRKALRTDEDGTGETVVIKYLRRRKFRVGVRGSLTMRQITEGLRQGAVILAYVDTDHVAVVHGIDKRYVYISDPSVTRMPGRRITREAFRRRFDRAGLIVQGPRK